MSLNWDVQKVADYQDLCFVEASEDRPMQGIKKGDRALNPVTNALVWATMQIGIGEITEANYKEFFGRIEIVQKTFHPLLNRGEEPYFIKLATVKAHIGLSTNVFPKEPAAKWLNRMIEIIARDAEYARERTPIMTDEERQVPA